MMFDQLKAAEGKDFDILYVDMQAQAHLEAVALMVGNRTQPEFPGTEDARFAFTARL